MKTKLFLLIFLFSFFGNAFSQQYHPLLNNTTWVVARSVSCCVPMRIQVTSPEAEVVIGEYTYTPYPNPFAGFDSNVDPATTIYLREDIAQRKVYKLVDGVDVLLFDFSMETGDTITQYGYTWTATIDEMETNVGMRKRITLTAPYNSGHNVRQIWIEGIGTNKHPFFPEHNMYSFLSGSGGISVTTACVYQNGEHLFGEEDCATMLSVTSDVYSSQKVVFSPNPVVTELTISSELTLQDASFKLYNVQGQLVREINNLNGKQFSINRERLNSGLYLAELFEAGKLVKTAKIMID